MEQKDKIDYRFKLLYAIGMIMVVAGHCNGGGISLIDNWFPYYGLHLPLFVFCSGYFYKKNEDDVIGYCLKKTKTLVIPMYLYNIAYGLIVKMSRIKGFGIGGALSLSNIFIEPITNGHQFAYNMGGWFIAPLFMVEIFNVVIRKALKPVKKDISEWFYIVFAIILGVFGNQLACMGYLENWWLVLVRMLYFVPFYELGILYKRKLEIYDSGIPNIVYFGTVFVIKLAIIYYYGRTLSYTSSWCNDFTEGPFMPIIVGYLGIALWMRIANILNTVIGHSTLVNLIADNTYSIMMNQFLGFMVVKTIYALISKFYSGFNDFDWISYKNNIWWYYIPKGINNTLIIYFVAGITIPIMIQKLINCIKKYIELFLINVKTNR